MDMQNFISYYSHYGLILAVFCLAFVAVFYYRRHKNSNALLLCTGLVILMIGTYLQKFIPYVNVIMNDDGQVLSQTGPPYFWYIGSFMVTTGYILSTIGFAGITFKKSRNIK